MHVRPLRLALTAGIATALFAGCSSGPSNDRGGPNEDELSPQALGQPLGRNPEGHALTDLSSSDNHEPEDVDPDGELTVGYNAPHSSTLDPAKATNPIYPSLIYDTLTRVDDRGAGTVEPGLATGWQFEGSDVLVMQLRDGVQFQDGTPIDAAAVKVNIDRYRDAVNPTSGLLKSVASVDVVDAGTVRFNLSGGGAELPAMLSQLPGMMVSPAAIEAGEDINSGAGGSGAYKVVEFKPNEVTVFEPSGTSWDKRRGLLRKLTIQYIADGPQRINALRAGSIDVLQGGSTEVDAARQVLEQGQFDGSIVVNATNQLALLARATLAPTDNPKIREAIAHAIDRKPISDGFYQGTCPTAEQHFLPGHYSHDDSLGAALSYDPERAKQLVEESGVPNPEVTIVVPFAPHVPVATIIQKQLEDVGIEAEVVQAAVGDFTRFAQGKENLMVGSPTAGVVVDPSQFIASVVTGGQALKPNDAEIEGLIKQGSDPAGNLETWGTAYKAIWQRTYGDGLINGLCNPSSAYLWNDKVANPADLHWTQAGATDFGYLYVAKR